MAAALDEAARHGVGHGLWVAILDLDRFKAYNDEFGHLAGDQLLRAVVTAWTHALPADATLARYGGEEFTVLLPDRGHAEVVAQLQGLRGLVPENRTCSIGAVAWWPGATADTLLRHADSALYQAKRQGRDQLVIAAGAPAESTAEMMVEGFRGDAAPGMTRTGTRLPPSPG